jgi:hypothetical protein
MNVTTAAPLRTTTKLQFGIYRDGDNNLDGVQSAVIDQAFATSRRNPDIAFDVEDFTARADFASDAGRRSESYGIRDGKVDGAVRESAEHNPSSRAELARFVAHTLDEAERNGATQTWVDLVDHGGADAGGLENHAGKLMRSDDIAGAIADGIALHAQEHPEDGSRRIDGVVANQCLMATLGFSSALSHAGVRYLAASPETMLAPGVPTDVAGAIAHHEDDPGAMAHDVVKQTMHERYEIFRDSYHPAAAFDVLDCDPSKIATMERAIRTLDGAIAKDSSDPSVARAVRNDAAAVDGMVRFTDAPYPYKSDRPAHALYDRFAHDARLPEDLRSAAASAEKSVDALVLAHAESRHFRPFDGASYADAGGPTVHFAANAAERDPWAPKISETDTKFYAKVGAGRVDRALGTA